MDEQLIDLQTRLAFQEETIAELNKILTDQQRQLDKLQLEMNVVAQRCRELVDAIEAGPSATDEKPPHY